jgi:hypothetical protein
MSGALDKPELNPADQEIAELFGKIRMNLGAPAKSSMVAGLRTPPKSILDHIIKGGFKKSKGLAALVPILLLALMGSKEG